MALVPPGLETAIQDLNVAIIGPDFVVPSIQTAYKMNDFDPLHAVLNRLLDPDERYDDILNPEDVVSICVSLGGICDELSQNANTINTEPERTTRKRAAQRVQGLIAWTGLSSAFVVLAALVGREKTWYKNPSVEWSMFHEMDFLLLLLLLFSR